MRIMFAAIPAYGHTYPLMPLALACIEAGHQVILASSSPMTERVPVPTFQAWHSAATSLSDIEAETARRHPDAAGMDFAIAMFGDVSGEVYAESLLIEFGRRRPHLVIFEPTCVGAAVAASVHGVPAVAFAIGAGWIPFGSTLYHNLGRYLGRFWTDRGLPIPDTPALARAILNPVPPTWLAADDAPWPAIPIRTVAFSHGGAPAPDWLRAKSRRPRVYITLGTVSFGAVDTLRRAIVESVSTGAEVLVAVGPAGDPALLGPMPDVVHLERFVAQEQVLPLVDVVVHHGGFGTTLGAMQAGVPQLILPQGADQYVNAARLTQVGAGRGVPNEAPDGSVGAALREMLDGSAEREVSRLLAAEIAATPAPAEVAARLPELLPAR